MRLTTLKSDTKSLKPVLFLDRDGVVNIDYGYLLISIKFLSNRKSKLHEPQILLFVVCFEVYK